MRSRHATPEEMLEQAEILSLRALAFVLDDARRAERFLALTGLAPDRLRSGDLDRSLQTGVLDFLVGDEPLLLEFCAWAEVDATVPGAALRALWSGDRRD